MEIKAVNSRLPKQGEKNNALVLRQMQGGKVDIRTQGDTQLSSLLCGFMLIPNSLQLLQNL